MGAQAAPIFQDRVFCFLSLGSLIAESVFKIVIDRIQIGQLLE